MKKFLILTIISTIGFSQTEEWIYYGKVDSIISTYRIKPDGTNNETIMQNAIVTDISADGSRMLFDQLGNDWILLYDFDSIDTLDFGSIAKFTYDENLIVYSKPHENHESNSLFQICTYSITNNFETLIADSMVAGDIIYTMSPDKQKLVYYKESFQENYRDIVVVDIQNNQTNIIASSLDENDYISDGIYWGQNGYIYYQGLDINGNPQLFKLHNYNGEEPIQLSSFEFGGFFPLIMDSEINSELNKLVVFTPDETNETIQLWLYQLASNDITFISNLSGLPFSQSWSPDNSKVVFSDIIFVNNFPTFNDLIIHDFNNGLTTTIVDSAVGCIWVGDSGLNIIDYSKLLPSTISLKQNYPNPFNPATTISYQIPFFGFVEMFIYNINGKLVETLVNQNQQQGTQSVLWDSNNLSSGVYFYQLKLNGEILGTKQAILLK